MAYSEAKALKALDRASAVINRRTAKGQRSLKGERGDLCSKYRSIKPLLNMALPLVERVPLLGKKLADAVRFLMGIADMACPVT